MDASSRTGPPTAEIIELTRACNVGPEDPILVAGAADVGLIEALLAAGHRDITVIDASPQALQRLGEALREREDDVVLVEADARAFHPSRRYALWHDHGVFHSLTHPDDRQRYVEVVQQALRPEGHLVLTTLAEGGPQQRRAAEPAMVEAGEEGTERRIPAPCYSVETLTPVLGRQFELTGHTLSEHVMPGESPRRLLHCRFKRHAPHWPP